ncbi:MAG: cell division protein FtsQ/DivIB [Aquificaceae bacterium]
MNREGIYVGRKRKNLSYILAIVWVSSMALAGFFMPTFIDSLQYFKVKGIEVKGSVSIPNYIFAYAVGEFKNNWLFINEKKLLSVLNTLTDNSVEDVRIEKVFGKDGVILVMHVEERKPFLTVFSSKSSIFFDERGIPFGSKFHEPKPPYVYTNDVSLIEKGFGKLKLIVNILKDVNRFYLTDTNTVVYTKGGRKVLLPFLAQLNDETLEMLKKIYNMNIEAREIDLTSDKMAVVRDEE